MPPRSFAHRDENRIPTLIGVSDVDFATLVEVAVDPTTGAVTVDSSGSTSTIIPKKTVALDYSGANLIYVGLAEPGTAKSAASWQIMNLTYDGSSNLTDVQFADGDTNEDNVWDDRAGLSYS